MARMIPAILGLAVALLVGCTPEPRACGKIEGEFWAEYVYLGAGQPWPGTATCEVGPYPLTVDGGASGTRTLYTYYQNQVIVTDLVLKGCDVALEVIINENSDQPVAIIDGDMEIINNDLLMGTVRGRALDANGQWCDASFQARLQRKSTIVQTSCIAGSECSQPAAQPMGTVFAGAGG